MKAFKPVRIAATAAGLLAVVLCALLYIHVGARAQTAPARAVDMWGGEHDLRGLEWTLFDFVHPTGCGYCVLNASAYQENLANAFEKAGVHTFGVDVFDDQRDLIDYVKHHRIRFPILTEPDALWKQLRCPGLPGQSLFHNGGLVWSESETLTFRNYDRVRESLASAGLGDRTRPYRPVGPFKKALNCVYEDAKAVLIVGDEFEADARRFFPGLREVVFRTLRAGEVTDADLAAGSVLVLGSPKENAFLDRLRGRTPFRVRPDGIALPDTLIAGTDLMLSYCWPNPWNPERYLVVQTGNFAVSHARFPYDGSQDFVIARRSEDSGCPSSPLARGIFEKTDGIWSLPRGAILWEDRFCVPPAEVAACGMGGCPAPLSASGPKAAPPTRRRGGDGDGAGELSMEAPVSWPGRFPALCSDDEGCWVAWDRQGNGVYVARLDDAEAPPHHLWAASADVLPRPVDAYKPSVLSDGPGRCWVAWSELEARHYQVFAARVRPDGPPRVWRISNRANLDHHAPAITRLGADSVAVVWYTWEANARRPYDAIWNGKSWGAVGRVPTHEASQFAWYFSGTTVDAGRARYVWMQHYPALTSIVSATLTRDGWTQPQSLAAAGRYPSIAFDPRRSQATAVWQQWMPEASVATDLEWGLFTAVMRDGRWSQPEQLPVCPPGRNSCPVVTVDAGGTTWLFWSHRDPEGDARDGSPAGPRWRILCAVGDGEGWRGPYTVSDPQSDARSPAAAASGRAVWVAWHRGKGTELEVVARRVSTGPAGSDPAPTEWSTNVPTNN
jgi:hypothetical protein